MPASSIFMGKANFDKIILLTCLIIGSVLFYQNQKNYESKLYEKQTEISKYKIFDLSSKHFDLRNKFVQFNDADKYGLVISDLFLDCTKKIEDIEDPQEKLKALRSIDKIQLFIPKKQFYKLKTAHAILAELLVMFEDVVNQKTNPHLYPAEFTMLLTNIEEDNRQISFNILPFESFQIPNGHLTATIDGDTLAINSTPSLFCFETSNVEFKTKVGSRLLIENDSDTAWP